MQVVNGVSRSRKLRVVHSWQPVDDDRDGPAETVVARLGSLVARESVGVETRAVLIKKNFSVHVELVRETIIRLSNEYCPFMCVRALFSILAGGEYAPDANRRKEISKNKKIPRVRYRHFPETP